MQTATLSGATVGEWRSPLFRRCSQAVSAALMVTCLSTLFVGGIVLAVAGSPGWLLAPLAVGPAIWIQCRLALNIWRSRLTITTAEVVVAGVTRTHHVPLAQVDRFEPKLVQTGIANGTPMIVLRRHGAAPIGVYALSRQYGFVWSLKKMVRSLEPEARELNLALARARNGGFPLIEADAPGERVEAARG